LCSAAVAGSRSCTAVRAPSTTSRWWQGSDCALVQRRTLRCTRIGRSSPGIEGHRRTSLCGLTTPSHNPKRDMARFQGALQSEQVPAAAPPVPPAAQPAPVLAVPPAAQPAPVLAPTNPRPPTPPAPMPQTTGHMAMAGMGVQLGAPSAPTAGSLATLLRGGQVRRVQVLSLSLSLFLFCPLCLRELEPKRRQRLQMQFRSGCSAGSGSPARGAGRTVLGRPRRQRQFLAPAR